MNQVPEKQLIREYYDRRKNIPYKIKIEWTPAYKALYGGWFCEGYSYEITNGLTNVELWSDWGFDFINEVYTSIYNQLEHLTKEE